MPFTRGRYHINAIAGEALEAAREAEAALLALGHDAAQAGGEENEGDDTQRRPKKQTKRRFTALKSKRQNWCRRLPDALNADLWRVFTEKLYSRIRTRATIQRGLATRCGRDSRHYDRREPDRCRRRATRRVPKRTYSLTIVIWRVSCVTTLRNIARVGSERQGASIEFVAIGFLERGRSRWGSGWSRMIRSTGR